jgi:hypothetical protein
VTKASPQARPRLRPLANVVTGCMAGLVPAMRLDERKKAFDA